MFRRVASIERGLCAITIGFEAGEASFQPVVEIGHAILDELVAVAA